MENDMGIPWLGITLLIANLIFAYAFQSYLNTFVAGALTALVAEDLFDAYQLHRAKMKNNEQ
jgi:branched-subunit amino acid transport protein